ncbi:MAG: outer membrane beta-barrel protein [Bacteroidales bacterium]|jgi:opacity protein-like surface antigen
MKILTNENMKKNYFIMSVMVLATSVLANNLFAQGAYVNINAGYGLKMSSQNMPDYNMSNLTMDSTSSKLEQINASLGKGFNVEGAFGYMFTKNIGAELGISYLLGAKVKAKDTYMDGSTADYILSANMLGINPSVVIAYGLNKINPYAKFGLIIGFGSITYKEDHNETGSTEVRETKLNGGTAFGLNAGAGVIFKLSKLLSLFGEIEMVNLSYSPAKGKLTKYTINGADQLPNLKTSEKEIDFVDQYTMDSKNPRPDSEPRQELKQKLPFGSVGLNIGLRIRL